MTPPIYAEYLRIINEALLNNSKKEYFDSSLFIEEDVNYLSFTIKNYNKSGGLSKSIHENKENESVLYKIKGPMGKGLKVEKTGTHIAFTAGTGVLLFLDLVAHLIRKILNQLSREEDLKFD